MNKCCRRYYSRWTGEAEDTIAVDQQVLEKILLQRWTSAAEDSTVDEQVLNKILLH